MVLKDYAQRAMLCAALFVNSPSLAQINVQRDTSANSKADALSTYQALRSVEKKLLKSLEISEGELARINQQINQVRIDLSEGNRKLNALEQERRTLEASIAPITDTVRTRLKARQLSLKRGEAFLRLMVQKDGATAFLRSRGYLNAVASLDLRMLQRYQLRRKALNENTDKLSTSKERLLELEISLASKATQVDALSERRFALLEQAKQEKRRAESIAKAHGLSQGDLQGGPDQTLQMLRSKRLIYPVAGSRLRAFGPYIDARFDTNHFSNGWLFKTAPKTSVRVIEAGKVLYAGWFKGYGNLIIVEHTPRIHSLYAHLGAVRVMVNDMLTRNEIIALTGDVDSKKPGHMYFEIRKDKVALDPKLVLNTVR